MTPLIIFVGDITDDLCSTARQLDPTAYVITASNIANKHSGTACVSLGNLLKISDFFNLLSTASKIVYAPPRIWSDNRTSNKLYSLAWMTEHYIRLVATLHNIPIENAPAKTTVVNDPIARKTLKQQIWLAGCSTTFGLGVEESQIYGNIVTQTLGLESINLAAPGSSIAWSRDEILKSDIKENDIVIWGITTKDRFSWFDNSKMAHVNTFYYQVNPEFDKIVPLSLLDSDHRIYESLSSIQQVNNFCSKIGAHLILLNIHGNLELLDYCAKYKGFIMMHGAQGLEWDSSFLDFGTDQQHPGPKTHQHYANLILEKINNLNIGKQ